jgi:hypothetical protein
MSDQRKKYPKAVRAIYVAGQGGEEGRAVEVDTGEPVSRANVSRQYRDWNREVRAMSLAAAEFFKTYIEHHDSSNEETRDGAIKHFGKNAVKAHKAALKVLQNNSKVFDTDPSEIHDNIVEYFEELEEEYENDDED